VKKVSPVRLPPDLASAIVGVWKLKSREDVDASGKVHVDPFLGPDPIGILCFGRNHFAAQFMKRDRSHEANTTQRIQTKNNTAAINGYDAYFGTYRTDQAAGTLTTDIEGSIYPDDIGSSYVRKVWVLGDELIVRLETTAIDGTPVTRTNTFSRLA
jgi:hypothetical protein